MKKYYITLIDKTQFDIELDESDVEAIANPFPNRLLKVKRDGKIFYINKDHVLWVKENTDVSYNL